MPGELLPYMQGDRHHTAIGDFHLGKAPPKRSYAEIQVKFADYVKLSKLPKAPPVLPSIGRGITFGMFLNDAKGDCTIAAEGHKVQIDTRLSGAETAPTDAQVMKAYHETGVEQGLSDDDGRYMEGVLSYMKRVGLETPAGLKKTIGYAAVNWLDHEELRAAIWLFGGGYCGLNLPLSAYDQYRAHKGWSVITGPRSAPGSWGGHATTSTVPGTIITWATRQPASWAWRDRYTDEAYGVLTEAWCANVKAPNGFARDELIRDLQQL